VSADYSYYAVCKMWSCLDEDTCYKVSTTEMDWHDAVDYCRDMGVELASVHSAEENAFINSICTGSRCWIGLSDFENEGEFVWSDGSDLDFLYWLSGEPNNNGGDEHYVHLGDDFGGYWNDVSADYSYYAVCKWSTWSPPSSQPSSVPTRAPSREPTLAPSREPTPAPTREPTPAPTSEPTPAPSSGPTPAPSIEPSPAPSYGPSPGPSIEPSPAPPSKQVDTEVLLGMSFTMSVIAMVLFMLLMCLVVFYCGMVFRRQQENHMKAKREMVFNGVFPGETGEESVGEL